MIMIICCRCCLISCLVLHPVRIATIHCPRFVPRVGMPRNLFLIGSFTAALRFVQGLGPKRRESWIANWFYCLLIVCFTYIYIYIYIYELHTYMHTYMCIYLASGASRCAMHRRLRRMLPSQTFPPPLYWQARTCDSLTA